MRPFYRFLLSIDVFGWLHRAQGARQAALLSVLATATENGMPVDTILEAFAVDSRAGWRHGVRDVTDMLQAGTSLPDALEAVPGLLPPESLIMIRVGAESGALAPALRMAAERLTLKESGATTATGSVLIYLLFVSAITLQVIAFVMIWIVPKLAKIFEDFDAELPALTVFVIEATESAAIWGVLFLPFLAAIVWVILVLAVAAGRPTIPLTGPFALLARTMPRIATGDILRNLSLAVSAGRPLVGALTTLAGFHPSPTIRRRIAEAADDVEQGRDCWIPLVEAGLLKPREATLLEAAERAGNLDWALRRTADSIDGRISFRFSALVAFIRPLLLLMYGVVVGVVVVGLFMPLVKLLNDLS